MFEHLYALYGKKVVLSVLLCATFLFGTGIYFFVQDKSTAPEAVVVEKAAVALKKVSELGFQNTFSTVGTVQAVSEARLQTETGGRVTSVTTELGKTVKAGSVIASIENSAERAQLLQAEGAYDAAVAAAASSEVGVGGAKNNLGSALTSGLTIYQDAYISVDGILHTTLEDFFTVSNGKATGLKIDGKGKAQMLNAERTELESVFQLWSAQDSTISKTTIATVLDSAYIDTLRISRFIEELTALTQDQDVTPSFSQTAKDELIETIFGARTTISAVLKQIEGARVQITSAQRAVEQAEIAGALNAPSAASAQVKIALGALRGAQANYEKTLVRTPISGVVNALYLKTGEYVSQSAPAAIIANNNGLEVETSVSEDDRTKLSVDDEVIIDSTVTGIVSAIAGAVDPTTGKVAIKISVDDTSSLRNGSTVSVDFKQSEQTQISEITVPLSSLKMTGNGPIAFEVTEEQKLKAIPVTLGTITGDSVVVTHGLTSETTIVVDARGLKDGQEVNVTTN